MVRTAERERGKKKGGGRKSAMIRELASAALLFPLLTPYAMHHSASDDRSWRNLLRFNNKLPENYMNGACETSHSYSYSQGIPPGPLKRGSLTPAVARLLTANY